MSFVVDHAAKPALIGVATRLPFVWVLIRIIRGVETLGLLAVFVGPAAMAALVLIWREWVADDRDMIASMSPLVGPE
jgi:predicted PurR-regulated permease PerM